MRDGPTSPWSMCRAFRSRSTATATGSPSMSGSRSSCRSATPFSTPIRKASFIGISKPGNLLITDLDGRPAPKVIDFGIAKAMSTHGRAEPRAHAHRAPHRHAGVHEPEQAQLSPLDVDTRADIYSLGVVLHELLTGLLPLETNRAPTSTPEKFAQELLDAQRAGAQHANQIRATSKVDDAAAARRLTPRQLMNRPYRRSRLDRAQGAREGSQPSLRIALGAGRGHSPPSSPTRPCSRDRPRRSIGCASSSLRHHFGLRWWDACSFGSIVLFGALMWRQANEIRQQRDEARFQAQRAEASSEFMSVMLEEVGPPDKPLTPIQLLEKGVELLDRQYSGDPRFAAQMYLQISNRFADLGGSDRRAELLAKAASIAQDVGDDSLLASIECTLARAESQENRIEQAGEHLKNAARRARAAQDAASQRPRGLPEGGSRTRGYVGQVRRRAGLLREGAGGAGERERHSRPAVQRRAHRHRRHVFQDRADQGCASSQRAHHGNAGPERARWNDGALRRRRQSRDVALHARGNAASGSRRRGCHAARAGTARGPARDPGARDPVRHHVEPARPLEEAIRILTEAREQSEALGNRYWIRQASYQLATSYVGLGRPEVARPLMEDARIIAMANPAANVEHLAELARATADLALSRRNLDEAKSQIESSLEQYGYPAKTFSPGCSAALMTAARIYLAADQKEKSAGARVRGRALDASRRARREGKRGCGRGPYW